MKLFQLSAIPFVALVAGCASQGNCPQPLVVPGPPQPAEVAKQAATPAAAPIVADPGAPSPSVMRQLPVLPVPSPGAEVKQQVGLTDVTVKYSSPAAKGRKVWGELVPYGKVWRAGANAATRVSFSREVTVGGKALAAGSYALFVIPNEASFTVVLNTDPKNAGVYGYDEKNDVHRFEAAPEASPARERMIFLFEDTSDEGTKLVLDWAGKRVAMPIQVDTQAHVKQSLEETMSHAWRPVFNAGRYALDGEKNPEKALKLFQQSIAIHESWWNHWWTAETLAKLGRAAEAKPHAEKARELGKGDTVYERAFAERVEKAIADWGAK